ncbi:MAG: 2-amino-4-hydroxy-6-hydroxymethyldihydropteridine diphosphokinase [Succinivibrionaceae bacterium]|nr:2-amino-4-hydroxy-6-hydroxymethyldihydropteridine diphosphokinase [Succinivibrionaceae bacterium]
MVTAYIGLGSNLENPQEQVLGAINEIKANPKISNFKISSLYHSKPVGVLNQPTFTNAVASFETTLLPLELLDFLQSIEQNHKRVRLIHWGPRTLDLDILYYGDEVINNERLIVPHKEILNRAFVIIPLLELNPEFKHLGKISLKDEIPHLPQDDVNSLIKIG